MNTTPQSRKESCVITRHGYCIPLEDESIPTHKKTLTCTPISNFDPGYKVRIKPIRIYRQNKKFFIVPRYYGLTSKGVPSNNCGSLGKNIELSFEGKLRPYQKEAVEKTLTAFYEPLKKGGVLAIGTGLGKTVIALNIIAKMGKKTIIVVNKEVLLNQWIERIKQFIPKASIGIIRQNKKEIVEKDIVLAMLQSLSMKDYDPRDFNSFGLLVCDECHNICSRTFSKALFKVQPEFRLGLSATPERKDGMTKVLFWHLGPIIVELDKVPDAEAPDNPTIEFVTIPVDGKTEIFNRIGKPNSPLMINELVEDSKRNKMIVEKIKQLYDEGRTIIVFTDRLKHCGLLSELLSELLGRGTNLGIIKGGTNQTIIEEVKKTSQIIIATYGMCKEGFDCPRLDTCVLATPKSDIVQTVGRIMRRRNPLPPLIVDIVDPYSIFKGQYWKRKGFYRRKNWLLEGEVQKSSQKDGTKPHSRGILIREET